MQPIMDVILRCGDKVSTQLGNSHNGSLYLLELSRQFDILNSSTFQFLEALMQLAFTEEVDERDDPLTK